jgi:hypothetical protein
VDSETRLLVFAHHHSQGGRFLVGVDVAEISVLVVTHVAEPEYGVFII